MSLEQTTPDKNRMKVTQQIVHLLLEVIELHPKYSIAQHLSGILRRKDKDGNGKEFYLWSNAELLRRVEQYKDEVDGEEIINDIDPDEIL